MKEARISVTFMLLAVTFCVCLIVSNLMEIKTVSLGPLTITAGVIVFPLSYILNDCIVEVYGFAKARLVIWLGFGMNLLVALLLQLGIWLPGAESWHGQEAMEMIFGAVPRIFVASFAAFLCGSMVNAYVMARMKLSAPDGGRGGFSLRAILSSLWGEGTDSLIFFPIAFGGILPWSEVGSLIVTQALLKTGYEIVILPVPLRAVERLRGIEGDERPSKPKSYKWWRINEL
ncbi:MAG: queuosine precursor transporter [Duncaniella sp.]|nr:queuosine precursor transporter [Duncaniella sp.]